MDKYIEQGIRVFKMNEYEWYAAKLEYCEDINEWYISHIVDDNNLDNVELVNLDTNGVWWETKDINDIHKLGDKEELCTGEILIDGVKYAQFRIGDLYKKDDIYYKLISFREAIKTYLKEGEEFLEPMLISVIE
ncbi:hypothetical protein ACSW9O_15780 (plasmid) [Clostridium perfringens]